MGIVQYCTYVGCLILLRSHPQSLCAHAPPLPLRRRHKILEGEIGLLTTQKEPLFSKYSLN